MSEHHIGRFSWSYGKERETPTKGLARRPGNRDMTGGLVANDDMLRGLYHGMHAGLQFASPLCFTPINLLVQMMGYPTPVATNNDPVTQAALDYLMLLMGEKITRTHRGALITGNAWRWPRFDSKELALAWEAIPDSNIPDILVDVASERPLALLTDEMIKLSTGENRIIMAQRKRRFEARTVDVKWYGQRPTGVLDSTGLNVSGMLPVNFANDADEGDLRGYSVFARVIRNLKDYHDISFRVSETLAKFRPKQVQTVAQPSTWLAENGLADDAAFASLDIADNDFVLNRKDETTAFEFLPEGATAALEKALERHFWTVVEGTGIPELFWGPLATGNHASTETQLEQAVGYANEKRKEFSPAWKQLIAGSLRVLSVARGENYSGFDMGWNRLEAVSASVKSEILLRFSQTAAALVGSGACTKKQLYTLWTLNFPESDPGKYEEFIDGIGEMAQHKQFLGLDYASGLEDLQGADTGLKDKRAKDESLDGEDGAA
jgi:hypothetical protein